MTDPIRSALKRLLSAVLDGLGQDDHPMGWARVDDAIDAARAALAQPESEVVGPTLQLPEQAPDEHPPSNLDRREIAAWYHGHACGWQAARAALAAEADGPAVPDGREPASVVGEPSDGDLLQLMPEQFRADLGTVSRMAAHGAGPDIKPGLFRVSLNTGALEYARAVLARWGSCQGILDSSAAPAPAGEVGELVAALRADAECAEVEHYDLCSMTADQMRRAADLLERQAAPVPVAIPGEEYHEDMGAVTWWRLPVDEPPWVGTPNDSDWPGYHTHFTPAPPEPSTALPLLPEGAQVIEPAKHTILVPVPVPVPVSERLPGPGDCDGEGFCWFWSPEDQCWFWERQDSTFCRNYGTEFHWLPATALPLPQGEVQL